MSNEAKYAIARVEAALRLIREEAAYIAGYRAWAAKRDRDTSGQGEFR